MQEMQCDQFQDSVAAWMEGERTPAAEAHLRSCASCRELLAELEGIRLAGAAMGDVDPPPRVWASIRAQLEQENLAGARGWRAWIPSFGMSWPRPAVAMATLAVLVAGSFLLGTEVHN